MEIERIVRMFRLGPIPAAVATVVALLALTATPALSAPTTVPAGLNPGDSYRLAFLTGSATTAGSGNIADYNAFVTNVANSQAALSSLGTTWAAIGSTSTVDARDNTGTNPIATGVPIFLLDGVSKLADDNADLWDGTIDTPLNVSEAGNVIGGVTVWTGTAVNGTRSLAVNANELGATAIAAGSNSATGSQWMLISGNDRTSPMPLYVISGVLTVPSAAAPVSAAPAASTWGILGLASLLAAIGVWTITRRFPAATRGA
jgi:hypothetical protein